MANKKRTFSELSLDVLEEHSTERIRQQLDRIINNPAFEATKAQNAFLSYVVEKVLSGNAGDIKGYTVATEVFGREEDFDQATDPVVSIHANKLRRALERYYLIAGQNDPVRIDIPKGSYVPVFRTQTQVDQDTVPADNPPAKENRDTWPSLLITPFKNLTGEEEKDSLCIGLASELAVEITHFNYPRVMLQTEIQSHPYSAGECRFVLEGNIQEADTGMKLTYYLKDMKTGLHISGNTYRSTLEEHEINDFWEQTINSIAFNTAGICGAIPNVIAAESRFKPATDLNTCEAIARYYKCDHTPTPENFQNALEALTHAAASAPDCGQVWSALGHLYSSIHGLDFPGFDNPIEKAVEYAELGARMDMNGQRSLAILAMVRLHCNELVAASKNAEHALKLNPNSLLYMDGLGYIMTLSGKWEAGTELIRKAIRLNPSYRPTIHYALWLDFIRQKDYDSAYLETLNLKEWEVFWYPLARAATLGLVGKTKEAEPYLKKMLELRPDFHEKSLMLIKRFIKFDDLAECVMDGLRKAGLEKFEQGKSTT